MTTVTTRPFGATKGGKPVTEYRMENANGTAVTVMDLGGTITSFCVKDRAGKPTDIVLGYDTVADYESGDKFLGALIGRHANRIAAARFTLNGKDYPLAKNDGNNHLHGGNIGFDKKLWKGAVADGSVTFTYESADGEEGYPGNLTVRVRYTLDDDDRLTLDYTARTDADTVCNLTNHSYFNLAGHASGDVLDQQIHMFAEEYTPADAESLPDGTTAPVAGTPLDLRRLTRIGDSIDAPFDQLTWAGGYDHNFVVDGEVGKLRPAAEAYSPLTGIHLFAETTLPGMQFYSGNYLGGIAKGKGGAPYDRRWGFCLESQYFPNAMAHPDTYIPPILRAGEEFHAVTSYRVTVK